jgi:hypothetical protein
LKPFASLLSICLGLYNSAAGAALKPGDPAPDFTVRAAQGGKEFTFSLAEALKKGPVVLYFYPKSFTSICTIEAHEFAENIENFKAAGAAVIGLFRRSNRCAARVLDEGMPGQISGRRRSQTVGHQSLRRRLQDPRGSVCQPPFLRHFV